MRTLTTRIATVLVLVALLASASLFSRNPAQAQTKKVICDADVILSLYMAESYFNLDTILTKFAATPAGKEIPVVDIASLEKGQYEPLFAALKNTKPQTMVVDDKGVEAILKELTAPNNKMMDGSANILKPALIAGEPAECSVLRAQLNFFYTLVATQRASAQAK